MHDKSSLLKTEMLRITEQIKLYEHKTFRRQKKNFPYSSATVARFEWNQ